MGHATARVGHPLTDRFDTIAWGLVAVLAGAVALPDGAGATVLAAVAGASLVGLNLARRATHLPVSWFSTTLGGAVLATAMASAAGVAVSVVALFFLPLGAVVIAEAVLDRG